MIRRHLAAVALAGALVALGHTVTPRGRARALRAVSTTTGTAARALHSLSLSTGMRYLDYAYPTAPTPGPE